MRVLTQSQFKKARQELVSKITTLQEADALLVRMNCPPQEEAKLARLCAQLGRMCLTAPLTTAREEGVQWVYNSLTLDPYQPDLILDLGEFRLSLGDTEGAAEEFERA